jgi:heat shock protein HslJ
MTMASRWLVTASLPLLVGAAVGCGGSDGVSIGDGEGTGGPTGDWVLVEGEHEGAEVPIVEGHDITLSIEDERWGGTAACNIYGATVSVDGDRVEIEDLAVTEMACMDDDVMASESAYLAAFAAVERYVAEPDELTLEDEAQDVRLRYEEVPAEPDAAFEDTEWRVESLLEGSGPDASVSSVQGEATLVFWQDGLLVAEDGCRSMEADWEPTDDGVRIGDLGYADVACPPELEPQVEHIREVLDGEVETTLEGGSLRLVGPDGRGLDLRAG